MDDAEVFVVDNAFVIPVVCAEVTVADDVLLIRVISFFDDVIVAVLPVDVVIVVVGVDILVEVVALLVGVDVPIVVIVLLIRVISFVDDTVVAAFGVIGLVVVIVHSKTKLKHCQ